MTKKLSPLPDIDLEAVREILRSLRFSKPVLPHPIQELPVLQQQLPTDSSIDLQEAICIQWLSNEITALYNQHRQKYDLLPITNKTSYSELLTHISQDFDLHDQHLEAWSILYYRHVRVDIQFQEEDLEHTSEQSQRTLRRRQARGYILFYRHLMNLT